MAKRTAFSSTAKTTRTRLEKQLSVLAEGEDQLAYRQRIEYIDELIREEARENRLAEPTIFLSFAGASGQALLQHVFASLRKLAAPDTGKCFNVVTGMAKSGPPEVMKLILDKIQPCCIFVGILTKENELNEKDDEGNAYAPGSWVLLETGMAIGLGLRIVLLVEEGIHKKYWLAPLGWWRHATFKSNSLATGLGFALDLVLSHYRDLRRESGG